MRGLVVVPLFGDLLPEFVASLPEIREHIDVLLVSNDPIRTYDLPDVVYNKENNIYSAWNIGIRESMRRGHEFTIISGTDIYLIPATLTKLYDLSVIHQRPYVCTRQLFDMQSHISFPRISFDKFREHAEFRAGDFFVTKAHFDCCAIRHDVIENVGFFNEEYKIYFGDSDFVWRMHEWGVPMVQSYDCLSLHMHKLPFSTVSSRQHSVDRLTSYLREDIKIFVRDYDHNWDETHRILNKYMGINIYAIKRQKKPFDMEEYISREYRLRASDLLG